MAAKFKIDDVLVDQPELLAEFEAYAQPRGRTGDECHVWLKSKGVTVGRTAVYNWLFQFRRQQQVDRLTRSSELAMSIKGAVDAGNFESVAEAAKMNLINVVYEQVSLLEQDGKVDPLDVQRMTRSLGNLVVTEEKQRKMLAEKFDREMTTRQKANPAGIITPEDIAAARKAIFG